MNLDDTTLIIRKALNFLFVANPRGTSIGIFFGVILDGLIGFFSPALKLIEVVDHTAIKMWHLIGFGVVLMNLGPYFKRNEVDPKVVSSIEYIEKKAKELNMPDWQVKKMYFDLFQMVLKNVTLDSEKEELLRKIDQETSKQES